MTVTAEQVLEKIKRLPPADLREVCQAVIQLTAQAGPAAFILQKNGTAPVAAQEEEEDANEASFFAALAELRQRGALPLDKPGFAP